MSALNPTSTIDTSHVSSSTIITKTNNYVPIVGITESSAESTVLVSGQEFLADWPKISEAEARHMFSITFITVSPKET